MSQQPITLTAYKFWNYVKDDADCDEVLELLGGHNELVSHFLYFSSLGHTSQQLREKEKERNWTHLHRVDTIPQIPPINCTIGSTKTSSSSIHTNVRPLYLVLHHAMSPRTITPLRTMNLCRQSRSFPFHPHRSYWEIRHYH
jgi:hypothetical protein